MYSRAANRLVSYSPGTYYPAVPPEDPDTMNAMLCIAIKMGPSGIVVTEGQRTPENHATLIANGINAAPNSQHRKGKAIDIRADGDLERQRKLLCAAAQCGYKWGTKYPKNKGGQVHVDMGPDDRRGNELPDKCCKID